MKPAIKHLATAAGVSFITIPGFIDHESSVGAERQHETPEQRQNQSFERLLDPLAATAGDSVDDFGQRLGHDQITTRPRCLPAETSRRVIRDSFCPTAT